jgi:hypothetical protein
MTGLWLPLTRARELTRLRLHFNLFLPTYLPT